MPVHEKATRYNEGKLGILRAIPIRPLIELARVYDKGNALHGRDNWRKGQPYSDLIDPAIRHILEYMSSRDNRNDYDGIHHLARAVWNLMTAMEQDFTGTGEWDFCEQPLGRFHDILQGTFAEGEDLCKK